MFYTLEEVIQKYSGLVDIILMEHKDHPLYDIEEIKKLSPDKNNHLEIGIDPTGTTSSWNKNDYFVRRRNLIVEIDVTNDGYTISAEIKYP